MGPPPPSGRPATSISRWFDRSWKAGVAATVPVLPLLITVWLLLTAATVGFAIWFIERPEIDAIRDNLGLDDRFQPTDPSNTITDSEAEAALDALRDLAWAAVPPAIIVGLLSWVVAAWTWVLIARRIDEPDEATLIFEADRQSPAQALRRVPALLASVIVVGLTWLAISLACFAPMLVLIAVAVGSDGELVLPIVVAAIFGTIGAIAATLFVIPRLMLAPTAAALGRRGLGIADTWRLTKGRWGATALRLLLMYLIGAVASVPISFVAQGAGLIGVTAFALTLAVSQTITALATTLVYATGSAVYLLDVEAMEAERRNGGERVAAPLPPQA